MTRHTRPLVVGVAAIAVLAAGSLVLVVASGGNDQPALSPAASPNPQTSRSTSTVAGAPTTTVDPATARLAARLDAAMAGTTGCLVAADGPSTLYADQPTGSFAPASTEKLLVAAAALSLLGPDFHFDTTVLADAPRGRARSATCGWSARGIHCWPAPSSSPMPPPSRACRATRGLHWRRWPTPSSPPGITGVRGGVYGDDSRYDRLRWLPAWPASYLKDQEIGALSALTVNEGIALLKPVPKLSLDPPGLAASELARLLTLRHVAAVPGGDATAPAGGGATVVAQVYSAPLSQIVEAMLRASDNLIAEMLVRELDRNAGGTGTTAGGLAVVLRQDAALGLPVAAAHMDDGSGLAPSDRASCPLLLAALDLANRPGLQAISQGLAVAGQTGTLVFRFRGTPEAGKLVAKTGSIANVAGMVGVLDVTRPVRFALLINQAATDTQLLDKEDQVVAALATYPG